MRIGAPAPASGGKPAQRRTRCNRDPQTAVARRRNREGGSSSIGSRPQSSSPAIQAQSRRSGPQSDADELRSLLDDARSAGILERAIQTPPLSSARCRKPTPGRFSPSIPAPVRTCTASLWSCSSVRVRARSSSPSPPWPRWSARPMRLRADTEPIKAARSHRHEPSQSFKRWRGRRCNGERPSEDE